MDRKALGKLLIVDDHPLYGHHLRWALTEWGWEVLWGDNPGFALRKNLATDAKVLLTGFQFADMTGAELIQRMARTNPNLAAVMMYRSDAPFPLSRPEFVSLPLVGILRNPLDADVTERMIRRAFYWSVIPDLRVMLSIFAEMELYGLVGS